MPTFVQAWEVPLSFDLVIGSSSMASLRRYVDILAWTDAAQVGE